MSLPPLRPGPLPPLRPGLALCNYGKPTYRGRSKIVDWFEKMVIEET